MSDLPRFVDVGYTMIWRGGRHMHGTGRGSGVPVEMRYGRLWTFRDGRPVRMELIYDQSHARRLAGLE
jgi:ketosteroid isomerase-like protein